MDIEEKVRILLRQATPAIYSSEGVSVHPNVYMNRVGPETFIDTHNSVSPTSEPAESLCAVYRNAGAADRAVFLATLVANSNSKNARVVARTLIATGNVPFMRMAPSSDGIELELWSGIVQTARFESTHLDESDLDFLYKQGIQVRVSWRRMAVTHLQKGAPFPSGFRSEVDARHGLQMVSPMDPVIDALVAVIDKIRYVRLVAEIRAERNPALDADRAVLVARVRALKFPGSLDEVSDDIERRAAVARSGTDLKSVMDLLRTFFEKFTEYAAQRVEGATGQPVPARPKQSHYAPYREYLQGVGVIGAEEGELLQKLYNFLSNQGAHTLSTGPEQLRVAHATVIEWCMLIAGRIQKLAETAELQP